MEVGTRLSGRARSCLACMCVVTSSVLLSQQSTADVKGKVPRASGKAGTEHGGSVTGVAEAHPPFLELGVPVLVCPAA